MQLWLGGAEMPPLYFLRAVEGLIASETELLRTAGAARALRLDVKARRAYVHGRHVPMPMTEWAVLESLAARPGRVVPREQIRREVALWSGKAVANAVGMYVFRLRLKLHPAGLAIHTVPRTGYVLR